MSRSIDERIVQMTFNNQEFERRASTTISTLGRLTSALNPTAMAQSFLGIQKAANGLDLSGVSTALDGVGKGFNVLEEIAVGALRRIGDAITGRVLSALNKVTSGITSLTVGQIPEGYNKYNDLTSSVQTLVNSTGKSVEEIDGYLKRLMWYSDETSFGFTDMTKALGTMVSSGGDIEKLIPMLMGVGNATAYAGKGASEFTRIIYNLNQSYSSGFLNTMDWRSIELAGADSKVLKEQLIAVGKELGTIKNKTAGLKDFKDLLSNKVFTRDVMEKAFSNFAAMTVEAEKLVNAGKFETAAEAIEHLSGNFEEFAERAFKSAQEAKSFKEAIEATQDAVSSGWMQTFQLIFGDYNESKALWTDVTNTFWELFASGASRRNDILEAWKAQWKDFISVKNPDDEINPIDFDEWRKAQPYLTQTQALVGAISDVILGIRNMISDVFRLVFPIHTVLNEDGEVVEDYSVAAKNIFNAIEKIRKGLIKLSEEGFDSKAAVAFRRNFMGILEVIKTIGTYARSFIDNFVKPLKDMLKPVLGEIVQLWDSLGKIIINTAQDARKDLTPFETFLSNILKILSPIITLLQNVLHWVNQLIAGTSKLTIFDGIFNTIGGVVEWLSKLISGTLPSIEKFGDIVSNVFTKVKDALGNFLESSGANMSKLAEGGFLAYLGYGLSVLIKQFKSLDISALGKNFLGGVGEGITGVFNSIKDGIETLFGKQQADFSSKLESLSNALIKLAAAVFILSLVDSDKIGTSLGILAGGLTEMITALAVAGNISIGKGIKTKSIQKMATTILELAIALKVLSTIDPIGMVTALVGLGVVLFELSTFIQSLTVTSILAEGSGMKNIGKTLKSVGFAMIEIAAALKILATIDGASMAKSLIGMGAALLELGAFIALTSKFAGAGATGKIAAIGPTMVGIGLALIEISAALKLMSKISSGDLKKSLKAMLAVLGEILAFVTLISQFTKGGGAGMIAVASGLLIIAAAISVLTVALIAMSAIGWKQMSEGILIMATMLVTVGGISAVLGLASPLILAFAVALTALGAAFAVASIGIIKGLEAFALLSVMGPDALGKVASVITDAFAMIIALIPSFILGIVEAVIQTAGKLIELVGQVIRIVVTAINDNLPVILNGIITFVSNVLDALGTAIGSWLPKIFIILETILSGTIIWLTNYIPTLLGQLGTFIVAVINGLADTVRSLGGELGSAIGNLASAIIEAIIGGLFAAVGSFASNLLDFGKTLIDSVTSFLQGDKAAVKSIDSGKKVIKDYETGAKERTPEMLKQVDKIGSDTTKTLDREKDSIEMGEKLVTDFEKGNENKHDELIESIDTVGTEVTDKMDRKEDAEEAAENTTMGFVNKIYSLLGEFTSAGTAAGEAFMSGLASSGALDYASPSKATARAATYAVQGFINTIDKETDTIFDSGEDFGSSFLSALRDSISMSEEILSSEMNPVISPVLDLSNIEENAGLISSMLRSGSTYDSALAINDLRNGLANQNGGLNQVVVDVNFTVNNAGADIDSFDLERFGDQIADAVNIKLGQLLS